MVIITRDLDTSLRLLPLTTDAILKQVRSVAPAWALLALAKDSTKYNTFEIAFKNWEAERPSGQA